MTPMSAVTQWATGCFREKGAVRGLLEMLTLCGFPWAGRCFMKASSKLQHDYKRFQVWEIWLFQREGMLLGKHSASSTAVYCLAIHIVLGVCVLGLLFLSQIINRSSFKYMVITDFFYCVLAWYQSLWEALLFSLSCSVIVTCFPVWFILSPELFFC